MDQLFGDLGDLVKEEDELREIWSNPETRVQFFKVLSDKGYDADRLEDMKRLIDAPNSDVQDFTPHIRAKAVLNLWAGVENVVGNDALRMTGIHPDIVRRDA